MVKKSVKTNSKRCTSCGGGIGKAGILGFCGNCKNKRNEALDGISEALNRRMLKVDNKAKSLAGKQNISDVMNKVRDGEEISNDEMLKVLKHGEYVDVQDVFESMIEYSDGFNVVSFVERLNVLEVLGGMEWRPDLYNPYVCKQLGVKAVADKDSVALGFMWDSGLVSDVSVMRGLLQIGDEPSVYGSSGVSDEAYMAAVATNPDHVAHKPALESDFPVLLDDVVKDSDLASLALLAQAAISTPKVSARTLRSLQEHLQVVRAA